jgi:hypothetical protein
LKKGERGGFSIQKISPNPSFPKRGTLWKMGFFAAEVGDGCGDLMKKG